MRRIAGGFGTGANVREHLSVLMVSNRRRERGRWYAVTGRRAHIVWAKGEERKMGIAPT